MNAKKSRDFCCARTSRNFFMAMLFLVLLAFLLPLFLKLFFSKDVDSSTSIFSEQEMSDEYYKRADMASEYILALTYVVEKTKNTEVRDILNMLKTHGVPVLATMTGVWVPTYINDKDSIRIVYLLPSDKKYHMWEKYLERESTAEFDSELRAIILKEYAPISTIFKGIILAHEGMHAMRFLSRDLDGGSNEKYCLEELYTHEFENHLLADLGGDSYRRFASTEADSIGASIKATDSGVKFPAPKEYNRKLDEIFGPTLSETEKTQRMAQIWVASVLNFIDKYYTGDKKEMKTRFLCETYYNIGALTKE